MRHEVERRRIIAVRLMFAREFQPPHRRNCLRKYGIAGSLMEAEGFRGAARECDHMAFHDLPPARLAQQVAEPCINLESSYQSQRPLAWLALLRFSDQERANGRRHAIPEPGLWRGSLAQPD